jgi:NTE family protein
LPQPLKRRGSSEKLSPEELDLRLALVTAEIATETKVDFPRLAPLFWDDPDRLNPAIYVRASMSIPFFFQPLIVEDVPQGAAAAKLWESLANYGGELPARCAFIDGGIMSNFPIGIFHEHQRIPSAPTFGISLGRRDRTPLNSFNSLWQLSAAIFDSARHSLDYDFIVNNPDYKRLVGYIDTDGFNWLDFSMSDQHKIDLFLRGVQAADRFLREFDWKEYKCIRGHLVGAHGVGNPRSYAAPVPIPGTKALAEDALIREKLLK